MRDKSQTLVGCETQKEADTGHMPPQQVHVRAKVFFYDKKDREQPTDKDRAQMRQKAMTRHKPI
jgi:hypothetical protein